MAKALAVICLLAYLSLAHGCIFAKTQAKEEAPLPSDMETDTESIYLPRRELKQFPGFPGFPGFVGGGGGAPSTGVSQFCGTVTATGGDPVLAPYVVSPQLKACFIRQATAWHNSNGNIFVAQFLRSCFHDCFPGHCDGSLFLAARERTGAGNENIMAAATIQSLRNQIQRSCGRKISYADAVRLGAATGVRNLGGPETASLLVYGKRDSAVAEDISVLPSSSAYTPALVALFQRVFRTNPADATKLLVTLAGAHTIGIATCDTFRKRKLGQDGLPASSVENLQAAACPSFLDGTNFNCAKLPFDPNSPLTFDNSYYKILVANQGFLTSDQTLYTTPYCSGATCAKNIVTAYSNNQTLFFIGWRSAFVRLCAR